MDREREREIESKKKGGGKRENLVKIFNSLNLSEFR